MGVIDGSLIAIISPPVYSEYYPACLFRTRKGFTGLNVLFISAADFSFTYVNARFPSFCHDSAIFRTSLGRLKLVEEYLQTRMNRGILLGDQGFGVEPWIFPSIAGLHLTPQEAAFNRAHKVVRMSVENSIGALKNSFRCLNKDRVRHYDPTFASNLIYAASALHNFRIAHNVQAAEAYEGDTDSESEPEADVSSDEEGRADGDEDIGNNPNDQRRRRRPTHPGELFTNEGVMARQRYIRNHFFF